jgi:hypothetical protein
MDNVPSTCIACDGVEDGELRCKGELPKSQSPGIYRLAKIPWNSAKPNSIISSSFSTWPACAVANFTLCTTDYESTLSYFGHVHAGA